MQYDEYNFLWQKKLEPEPEPNSAQELFWSRAEADQNGRGFAALMYCNRISPFYFASGW